MQNSLRTFRKKTELTLEDISQLLGMPYGSALSRCERGQKKPDLEILFAYHILFSASFEELFPEETERIKRKIAKNTRCLLKTLEGLEKTRKNQAKIDFLRSLKTLIEKQCYE